MPDQSGEAQVIFEPSAKQNEFIEAVLSGLYKYLVYGGAIRGGKTYVLLACLFAFCRIWPGSRWAIVRKDLPTIKRNLIPAFNKLAPRPFIGRIHKSDWVAECENGSQIIFFPESAEGDTDLNRWRGLEVNGILFEEINECQERSFYKAIERAGSWQIPEVPEEDQPPPLILGTCNPANNWVKTMFFDPWERGELEAPYFYLPAKITDNPHLPKAYIDSLDHLPPAEYKRFVEGDWSMADEPDQLIKAEWVDPAVGREPVPSNVPSRLGVDVARFGDDDSCLIETEGFHVHAIEAFNGINTMRSANIAMTMAADSDIEAQNIRVDTVGVGGGVADKMTEDGWDVTEFIAGAKSVNEEDETSHFKFKNLRAEAWWNTREIFRKELASIDETIPRELRARLIADLTAPRYSVDGDKVISIEPKKETKKRLGRSPDYGDALVQAWANMKKRKKFFIV